MGFFTKASDVFAAHDVYLSTSLTVFWVVVAGVAESHWLRGGLRQQRERLRGAAPRPSQCPGGCATGEGAAGRGHREGRRGLPAVDQEPGASLGSI